MFEGDDDFQLHVVVNVMERGQAGLDDLLMLLFVDCCGKVWRVRC